MNEVTVPMNVKVKMGKSKPAPYPLGTFKIKAKTTPIFILYFYIAARVFWLGVKELIN